MDLSICLSYSKAVNLWVPFFVNRKHRSPETNSGSEERICSFQSVKETHECKRTVKALFLKTEAHQKNLQKPYLLLITPSGASCLWASLRLVWLTKQQLCVWSRDPGTKPSFAATPLKIFCHSKPVETSSEGFCLLIGFKNIVGVEVLIWNARLFQDSVHLVVWFLSASETSASGLAVKHQSDV